jgi:four helix bundle protein
VGEQSDALARRIGVYSVAVLRFVRQLPRDVGADAVIRQVARSASGVSANYRAACCARSRAEFVSRLAVALEEADETGHWLWMAAELGLGSRIQIDALADEARQLRAILAASVSTARRNLKRDTSTR